MDKDKKQVWKKLTHVPKDKLPNHIIDFIVKPTPNGTDFTLVLKKK